MPMTRTQNLVAVSRKIRSRLGSLPTGEPPDDLLQRQALEGSPPPPKPLPGVGNLPAPESASPPRLPDPPLT